MNFPTTPGKNTHGRLPIAAAIRRIAAVAALTVTAIALSASAASAGSDERITTHRGQVEFLHYLDVLSAEDTKRDGLGIRAYLEWQGDQFTTHETFTDTDGADNGTYGGAIPRLREGTPVWLTMCYVNKAGRQVQCSGWQRATA